jgi:exosortase/archaeosortase family protein
MTIRNMIKRKALIIPFIIVLSLVFIYITLSLLFFDTDPLLGLIGRLTNAYLLIQERIANQYLQWVGTGVQVQNHLVMLEGKSFDAVRTGTLMRKWIALLLLVIWISPDSLKKKLLFSGIILVLNFMMSPVTIALQAYLNAQGTDMYSHTRISRTLAHLMNMTLLFVWLRNHREALWRLLSHTRIDVDLIKRKSSSIVLVSYVYLILGYFILGCFEFTPWVNFLFNASHKILSWFNIESVVESQVLIGDEGSLSMLKSCLGLNTMLLFASLIFVMGENGWKSWIYILSGLLLLNIANIMRLVLLFMHIQEHGTYVGLVDYHDLYDYIIYGMVFLMWVIWFEIKTWDNRDQQIKVDSSPSRRSGPCNGQDS